MISWKLENIWWLYWCYILVMRFLIMFGCQTAVLWTRPFQKYRMGGNGSSQHLHLVLQIVQELQIMLHQIQHLLLLLPILQLMWCLCLWHCNKMQVYWNHQNCMGLMALDLWEVHLINWYGVMINYFTTKSKTLFFIKLLYEVKVLLCCSWRWINLLMMAH